MKKFIDVSIGIIVVALVALFAFIPYYGIYVATKDAKFFSELYQTEKKRTDYFFDGANERGLLDICEKDGRTQVLFKEDCGVKNDK